MTTMIDIVRNNIAESASKPILCKLGIHKHAERQHIRWDDTRMNVCTRCGQHTVAWKQYK